MTFIFIPLGSSCRVHKLGSCKVNVRRHLQSVKLRGYWTSLPKASVKHLIRASVRIS